MSTTAGRKAAGRKDAGARGRAAKMGGGALDFGHEQGGSVAMGRRAGGRQKPAAGKRRTAGITAAAVSTPTAGRTGAAGTPIAVQGNERGYGSRVGQGKGGGPGSNWPIESGEARLGS